MTITNTQKTPVADELGGNRDEGLNSPTSKKESTTMVSNEIRLDEGSTIEIESYPGGGVELYAIIGPRTIGFPLTDEEAQLVATTLLEAVKGHSRQDMTPAKFAKQMREAN